MSKTAIEIIEETAKFYNSNNRSVCMIEVRGNAKPQCRYFHQGKMCAVGRCLENPKDFENSRASVHFLDRDHKLDTILKEEYRGLSVEFWEDLQNFHDIKEYWNENGLTDKGEVQKNSLVKTYS